MYSINHSCIKTFCYGLTLIACFLFNGCSYFAAEQVVDVEQISTGPVDEESFVNITPKAPTRKRYGNPKSYIVNGKRYHTLENNHGFTQKGIASWYGKKFHGRKTSNGEIYNMYAMTAAHKNLILPAYVEVTNLENGKKVMVKVNDRGPFHEDRIIDLSYMAAKKLDIVKKGTGRVALRVVESGGATEKKSSGRSSAKKHGAPIQQINANHSGSFFIQIGSFVEVMNAENLRNKINFIGDQLVNIQPARIDDTTFHRVVIGPLFDSTHADTIIKQLIQANEYNHHIIVY